MLSLYQDYGDQKAGIVITSDDASAVCYLTFYADSVPALPENRLIVHSSGTRQIYVSCRYSDYANTVDLLRNEKPLFFLFREEIGFFRIGSGNEPIGEHELTP
jgi:hypothetical protein